ncbi:MAG: hypothetical protein ACTSYA_10950 [Candidatus Kariarchaeaceae archaeon]
MSNSTEIHEKTTKDKNNNKIDHDLVFSLIALISYILLVLLLVPLRLDHILVIAGYSFLLLMKRYNFTKDLSPFLFVWLFYDGMAIFTDNVS